MTPCSSCKMGWQTSPGWRGGRMAEQLRDDPARTRKLMQTLVQMPLHAQMQVSRKVRPKRNARSDLAASKTPGRRNLETATRPLVFERQPLRLFACITLEVASLQRSQGVSHG